MQLMIAHYTISLTLSIMKEITAPANMRRRAKRYIIIVSVPEMETRIYVTRNSIEYNLNLRLSSLMIQVVEMK